METTEKQSLPFGYSAGLPDNCPVAWGARALYNGRSDTFQILGDRQGGYGPKKQLDQLRQLLGANMPAIVKAFEQECNSMAGVNPREGRDILLFERNGITVKANTQASYGYLYMCAFFTPLCQGCGRAPSRCECPKG